MRSPRVMLMLILLAVTPLLPAQSPAAANSDAKAILAVLDRQAADWNRGDIDAFATGYKDSPDILFIGRSVSHGYAQMLAKYKENYATRAKMGMLSFTALGVQPLSERFATATGHYHLQLSAAEGSHADGHFLLVFEKTPEGWKIVRDDTTTEANCETPPATK